MGWEKEEIELYKPSIGEELLDKLEKSVKSINYRTRITDFGNSKHHTYAIREEASHYPTKTKLKEFLADDKHLLGLNGIVVLIDSEKEYKDLSLIRYVECWTKLKRRKFDREFSKFKEPLGTTIKTI